MVEPNVENFCKELVSMNIENQIVEHPEFKSIRDVLTYFRVPKTMDFKPWMKATRKEAFSERNHGF